MSLTRSLTPVQLWFLVNGTQRVAKGAHSFGPLPFCGAAFINALSDNYPANTFLVFIEKFAVYVTGAAAAFCNNDKILDAILSELQSAVDGGEQYLKRRLTRTAQFCLREQAGCPQLLCHPKAGAALTSICDMVRTKNLAAHFSRPELLKCIASFCVYDAESSKRDASNQLKLGQQDGLIEAIEAELGPPFVGVFSGVRMTEMMVHFRLLGYCVMTCSWDRLLHINRVATTPRTDAIDTASVFYRRTCVPLLTLF